MKTRKKERERGKREEREQFNKEIKREKRTGEGKKRERRDKFPDIRPKYQLGK